MKDFKVEDFVSKFEGFLKDAEPALELSARDRDYYDHIQWTEEEAQELKSRGQAPVVINRMKRKLNTYIGMQEQMKRDPKALPRTGKHKKAGFAATDALRYVTDDTDFPAISTDVFEGEAIEGYAGCIIEVHPKKVNGKKEPDIKITHFPFDRFYFDLHSRKRDFTDASWKGLVIWMDEEEAVAKFPKSEAFIRETIKSGINRDSIGSVFDDKPEWADTDTKRMRVCQHFFQRPDGAWWETFFTYDHFLQEPAASKYLDDEGVPMCPIEAQAVYVDRQGNRYGEARGFIWIQDELNKRRSKMLHLFSTRQTQAESGTVDSVAAMKHELSKPDGHVVTNVGKKLEIIETGDLSSGQVLVYQDTLREMESEGPQQSIQGLNQEAQSGRAKREDKIAGMAEAGRLFSGHRNWEHRVYKQCWFRIRQFWKSEKWIRVTDDPDNLKYVGLNKEVTVAEALQAKAEEGDMQAAQMLQQLVQTQDPRLQQKIKENVVAEMDVDIIMSDGDDIANAEEEERTELLRLAQVYGPQAVPFEAVLEISNIRNKKAVLEKLQGETPEQKAAKQKQAQLSDAAVQLELQTKAAALENTQADTMQKQTQAQADQIDSQVAVIKGQGEQIQNQLVASQPPADSTVVMV